MSADDRLDALRWLTADEVRTIHDRILVPGNLPGEDGARPIESALARIEQRVHYGTLEIDAASVAAAYAVAIAKAHSFRDGNKRTALAATEIFLALNGYDLVDIVDEEIADLMEAVAGDRIDEKAVRAYLAAHVQVIKDDPDITVEDDDPLTD